jgi:hypothetical protein
MMQTVNVPIQLYCVISTMGDLTPILFKYEDTEHNIVSVKIDEIISHKETKMAGIHEIKYTCAASYEKEQKLFELKYSVLSHKWSIFQILS